MTTWVEPPYLPGPPYGLATYMGHRTWRVLGPGEVPSLTSSPPLAMVRHPEDDGFHWDFPEAPEVSRGETACRE